MRTIEGYLSRKAQARLSPSALVYREEDGTYTLERAGEPPLSLGDAHGTAQQALEALCRAARTDHD